MRVDEAEILDRYRILALEWAGAKHDPRKANRLFRIHHRFYKEIREP
ncbi:hypothetical protein BJY22_008019 [Kribbella shirazensis]|uniref:Uncharacterized protein n=1 Tax=Kribbella shirazensis TaxID=1105143 RepID=A0A7X5VKW2_9ACTN|nr:hypothetical protein [Kribbella shirazensis]